MSQGADPNHPLYWSEEWTSGHMLPPLHTACEKGRLEIVKLLVQGGADVDKCDGRYHRTPLAYACWGENMEVVVYLTKEAGCESGEFYCLNIKD